MGTTIYKEGVEEDKHCLIASQGASILSSFHSNINAAPKPEEAPDR
jgi:hypothetical protein